MSEQKWAVMSTMIGGWGVARPEHAYRESDGLLACTEWESLHDTWTEAMQEADRMSRTVTEWTDADKLRDVIEEARFLIRDGEPEIILNDLIALLAHARRKA